ncbi:type VII secretion target [Actinotalea solisilvae]|uniref:type VII secretion target n=1 Tax=Actinotalea solisilvae TaxID=2072922 RepID=UPI0018F15FE1|nr:type VII secretion target [Actinotalea solisilvae]
MSDIFVVTEALRKEATTWDEQAGIIASSASSAESLRLTNLTAGIFFPIVGEYESTVDAVAARCREGSTQMTAIASTLRRNADAYDRGDADVSQHVADAY